MKFPFPPEQVVSNPIDLNVVRNIDFEDFKKFVMANSKLSKMEAHGLVFEVIIGDDNHRVYCERKDYVNTDKKQYYDELHWEWVRAFYQAFPELNKIYITRD